MVVKVLPACCLDGLLSLTFWEKFNALMNSNFTARNEFQDSHSINALTNSMKFTRIKALRYLLKFNGLMNLMKFPGKFDKKFPGLETQFNASTNFLDFL